MKSACGIADNYVTVSSHTRLHGIIHNRGGIGSLLVLDYVHARTLRPYVKLVYRRRSEGIGCAEYHFFAL